MAVLLEVENLVKRYGSLTAVDDVSLRVETGRILCILGMNGAGKTTTLEVAQGLRRPTSGRIRLFGEDPYDAKPALRRRMNALPQQFVCFGTLTPRENLRYFSDIYGTRLKIDGLLERLNLVEEADRPVQTLSGGATRRVALATALVNDPELVFLDEPTAGVDPANRRRLWDVILGMRAQGRSIVLTTHYMDEAERLADEVVIIHRGRVVARGPPDRVRREHGGGAVLRLGGGGTSIPTALAARAGVRHDPDGSLVVPLASAVEAPLLLAELFKEGEQYKEINVREPSLDDAFVRLVTEEEQK